MVLKKLSSTDAFVVVDIPDAPATGIVRSARKILQGGAEDLARSASYTFAAFEMQRSGASAGINAEGDAVDAAIAAFAEELKSAVAAGELHLDPAKGVNPAALAPLTSAADRNPAGGSVAAVTAGVVAATSWALDGLDGRSVAIEGAGAVPKAVAEAVTAAGATVVEVDGLKEKPWMIWGAKADAIIAGSKAGTLSHEGSPFVKAKVIVPWGQIPVTAKAFAALRKADVAVLPDFVSAGGGLLAGYLDGDEAKVASDIADRITALLSDVGSHADGPLLGACYQAESFLATWTEHKLFGRPLAS
ncbi:MAG: hypothetical protein ACI8TP_001082 [Acidimicrobiales bacterium]